MTDAVFLLLLLGLLFGVAMQAVLARLAAREAVLRAPPVPSTARKRIATLAPLEIQETVRAPVSRPPRPERVPFRAASLRRDIVMMEILGGPRALQGGDAIGRAPHGLSCGAAWLESTLTRSTEDQRQQDREQRQHEDRDRPHSR